MRREVATILLNKLVDDQVLEAKEEIERKIEKALEEKFIKTRQEIMDMVEQVLKEGRFQIGEHSWSGESGG